MKNLTRVFAFVLSLCMLLSAAAMAEGTLPLTTEPKTLTIGLMQNTSVTDYEDNDYTKLIEERLGVDVEFFFFPADTSEAKQKLQLMIASNQELPDIISTISMTDAEIASYGAQGIFLPLNDLLEKHSYYLTMGLEKWCSEQEIATLYQYATSPDGNIYSFPYYYADPNDAHGNSLWINTAWLEKLDLEIPTTTEELYNVLVAFRDLDPNGNGEQDEIPLMGHTSWMGDVAQLLMNSFVYYSDYYWNAENGQLSAPYVQDAYRDGLEYMNKLCEEGLLSPLSFTQSGSQFKQVFENGEDQPELVGVMCAHPATVINFPSSEKFLDYECMAPMIGPDGVQYAYAGITTGTYTTHITKDCDDPELAIRFLDALCEETISMSARFGRQGIDWDYAEEGAESKYWEGFGYAGVYETPDVIWTQENNVIWHTSHIGLIPPALFGGMTQGEFANEVAEKNTIPLFTAIGLRAGKQPAEQVGNIIYTSDELEQIAEIKASIETYVNESTVRFVTGDLSVENDWDNYKAELSAMGLEYYQEIAQTAYTRMIGE